MQRNTPIQRTAHSNTRNIWSGVVLFGLMIVTAFWLIRFPLSLQAYKPVLSDNLQSSPQELVPLDGIMQVKAGNGHTCTLSTTGGVKCWGNNGSGQLGDGSTTNRTLPVDVVGLGSDVVAIAAGDSHNCALNTAGSVKCWGSNRHGQLGNVIAWYTTPVDVLVQPTLSNHLFLPSVQR